ncbi:MAG: N-6 DNA methylase [Demequinaceae bacterium]|nr:N-6 DNA methylase [Demequinaceae bacterium]
MPATPGDTPETGSKAAPESALRLLVTRALLTNEWADSVDARLSEACSVLDLPAAYARVLQEANIESWFTAVWATWGPEFAATLVPQLLDPRIASNGTSRSQFPFIPPDVIEMMTDWLMEVEFDGPPRIVDPCAGTGALVASLLPKLLAEKRYPIESILSGLRLIDADPALLDIACVIVAQALERFTSRSAPEILHEVRESAVATDAHRWFASVEDRFDLVVGAPPFDQRGGLGDAEWNQKNEEVSALYLRILAGAVADGGAGTMVASASILTSPSGDAAEIRDRLLDRFKTTEFLNYNGALQSLLGNPDGISHSVVRVLTSGTGEITTTPMMRWKPERRSVALTDPPRTTLHGMLILRKHAFVPRIGSAVERRLVDAVIAHELNTRSRMEVELSHGDHRGEDDYFSVGLSAYDRFSISLREPRIHSGGEPSASARFGVRPNPPELADPALAAMLSRMAFWWWTVTGDGRNVRNEHITLPLSWLRLMSSDELALGASVADAWRKYALAAMNSPAGAVGTSPEAIHFRDLSLAFEQVILSCVGTTESDAREFLATRSFADV